MNLERRKGRLKEGDWELLFVFYLGGAWVGKGRERVGGVSIVVVISLFNSVHFASHFVV